MKTTYRYLASLLLASLIAIHAVDVCASVSDQSFQEFRDEEELLLEEEETQFEVEPQEPLSLRQRVWQKIKKHPRRTIGAVVMLALLAGGGWMYRGRRRGGGVKRFQEDDTTLAIQAIGDKLTVSFDVASSTVPPQALANLSADEIGDTIYNPAQTFLNEVEGVEYADWKPYLEAGKKSDPRRRLFLFDMKDMGLTGYTLYLANVAQPSENDSDQSWVILQRVYFDIPSDYKLTDDAPVMVQLSDEKDGRAIMVKARKALASTDDAKEQAANVTVERVGEYPKEEIYVAVAMPDVGDVDESVVGLKYKDRAEALRQEEEQESSSARPTADLREEEPGSGEETEEEVKSEYPPGHWRHAYPNVSSKELFDRLIKELYDRDWAKWRGSSEYRETDPQDSQEINDEAIVESVFTFMFTRFSGGGYPVETGRLALALYLFGRREAWDDETSELLRTISQSSRAESILKRQWEAFGQWEAVKSILEPQLGMQLRKAFKPLMLHLFEDDGTNAVIEFWKESEEK